MKAQFLRICWALEIISSRESIGTQTSVEYGFTLPSILPYIETKANQRLCLADQSLDRSSGLFDSDQLKNILNIYRWGIRNYFTFPLEGNWGRNEVKYFLIVSAI